MRYRHRQSALRATRTRACTCICMWLGSKTRSHVLATHPNYCGIRAFRSSDLLRTCSLSKPSARCGIRAIAAAVCVIVLSLSPSPGYATHDGCTAKCPLMTPSGHWPLPKCQPAAVRSPVFSGFAMRRRIGLLMSLTEDDLKRRARLAAFHQGLEKRGCPRAAMFISRVASPVVM